MFGLNIFIATSLIVPLSLIWALWTWAIDAAATGSLKFIIDLNKSSPRLFLTIFFASSDENSGTLSCNFSNRLEISSPIISGLVAKNWPNLIKVVPIFCIEKHNLSPSSFKFFVPDTFVNEKANILKATFIIKGGWWILEIIFNASDCAIFLAILNNIKIFLNIKFSNQNELQLYLLKDFYKYILQIYFLS